MHLYAIIKLEHVEINTFQQHSELRLLNVKMGVINHDRGRENRLGVTL
jgi:hypothetical protein